MILQALTRHYEDLLKQGTIDAPGWGPAKISFALCLNADGELTQVIPTMREVEVGKKTVLRPQELTLPAAVGKTSGEKSNFLWENSGYFLGIKKNESSERSLKCFRTASMLHHSLLDDVDSSVAKAILKFFDSWNPENAAEHPALCSQLDAITAGGNLLFRVDGRFAQEDAAIQAAWQRHYGNSATDAVQAQCLVTGQMNEIAKTHPLIKGVRDAQSSGAALVSFNAPAFCSYGHEQNYNAPVGKYAAFAYTAALNHLLADRNNVQPIGDTTVVCWAEGADPVYQDFAAILFGGAKPGLTDNDLRSALKQLANGLPCPELGLDPHRPFYILGLAPNAARLSVRFFLRDTFGNLMRNVNDHYERLEIVGAKYDTLPLRALLKETVRRTKSDSKPQTPSPAMAGATARAVFSGGLYPASLLEAVMLRIRAERDITWGRAAILKAYVMRNIIQQRKEDSVMKEAANMELKELDENCTYMPYILGRLFSVMEKAQLASADWSINRTIKDSYFNAAASTPRNAFYKLFPLNEHHMKKLLRDKPGLGNKYSKLKTELTSKITAPIPARFTQEETICFYLGYYHQDATKKEENEHV